MTLERADSDDEPGDQAPGCNDCDPVQYRKADLQRGAWRLEARIGSVRTVHPDGHRDRGGNDDQADDEVGSYLQVLVIHQRPQQDSNLRTRLRRALTVTLVTCPNVRKFESLGCVWGAGAGSNRRTSAFQRTELPRPNEGQRAVPAGVGYVSGMIKRSEPNLRAPGHGPSPPSC